MPHLTIEYSANSGFDPAAQLPALHTCMAAEGRFPAADIKVRAAAPFHDYLLDGRRDTGFVHLIVWMLDGRSEAFKQSLSQDLAAVVRASAVSSSTEITVDVQDMSRTTYTKLYGTP